MSTLLIEDYLNPAGRAALILLAALTTKHQDASSTELIFDLGCLCRTLQALSRRFVNGYTFDETQIRALEMNLRAVIGVVSRLQYQQGTVSSVEQVSKDVRNTCMAVTRVMAGTRYILAHPTHFIIYPGDVVVQRQSGHDKYDMRKGCVLESEEQLAARMANETFMWNSLETSDRAVYEHVGRLDGGEDMYDPFFLSHDSSTAAEFFTSGRVFAMLWNDQPGSRIGDGVVHYDWEIEKKRSWMTGFEGVYTGPYHGPVTGRWFVVVHGGGLSCFCLSIVSFPAHLKGENIGERYVPLACNDERDSYLFPLHIQSLPMGFEVMQSKLQSLNVPPASGLPTTSLPRADPSQVPSKEDQLESPHAKLKGDGNRSTGLELRSKNLDTMRQRFFVDIKRLVEVECSVKVRNVGVVQQSEAFSRVVSMAGCR